MIFGRFNYLSENKKTILSMYFKRTSKNNVAYVNCNIGVFNVLNGKSNYDKTNYVSLTTQEIFRLEYGLKMFLDGKIQSFEVKSSFGNNKIVFKSITNNANYVSVILKDENSNELAVAVKKTEIMYIYRYIVLVINNLPFIETIGFVNDMNISNTKNNNKQIDNVEDVPSIDEIGETFVDEDINISDGIDNLII